MGAQRPRQPLQQPNPRGTRKAGKRRLIAKKLFLKLSAIWRSFAWPLWRRPAAIAKGNVV
jgi:hypothetical protein